MKYIRTKDTLASAERKEDIELFKRVGQKVADTIEELCDVFISNYHQPLELKSAREKIGLYKNFVVYGAIWTDKGLIYVAKMNENGELELL